MSAGIWEAMVVKVANVASRSSVVIPINVPSSPTPSSYKASPFPSASRHFNCVTKCSIRSGEQFTKFNYTQISTVLEMKRGGWRNIPYIQHFQNHRLLQQAQVYSRHFLPTVTMSSVSLLGITYPFTDLNSFDSNRQSIDRGVIRFTSVFELSLSL